MFLLQTEVPGSEITSNLMMPIWESNPHNLIDQSLLRGNNILLHQHLGAAEYLLLQTHTTFLFIHL